MPRPRRSPARDGRTARYRPIRIPGLRIGHASDPDGGTGITVFLVEDGAVAVLHVAGFASGTRQVDSLDPAHLVPVIQGLVLAGGSGFGLDATQGVVGYLEARGRGFPVGKRVVPIVPTAILFDLNAGDPHAVPTVDLARLACESARADLVEVGCVGAGTGASCGKLLGITCATKAGLGAAAGTLPDGTEVLAVAVANPYGDIVDPDSGRPIAGTRRNPRSRQLVGSGEWILDPGRIQRATFQNTTLMVVATSARLDKIGAQRLARMASAGMFRALRPAPTLYDGDVVFGLSTGDRLTDPNALGSFAADLCAAAVVDAARSAWSMFGLPASADLALERGAGGSRRRQPS